MRPEEQALYQALWEHDEYRLVSPGENAALEFLRVAHPPPGSLVLDLGCGTGRGGLSLKRLGKLDVTLLDFAPNCRDQEVKDAGLPFIQHDLTQPLPLPAPYGFCVDVLEHLPPEQVDLALTNILRACRYVFFQIATSPDVMGELVGQALHLTVEPYEWWRKKLEERDCVFYWSENVESQCQQDGSPLTLGRCSFYVSAWADGLDVVKAGALNTTEDRVKQNVANNLEGGWQQVQPHYENEFEVLLLGSGPSLTQFEDEIRAQRQAGLKLVTLNGAYNWCLERGLVPSATVVVDAREFNARFTHPVVENCRYLISSQCDPAVLEGLPAERTYLWHTTAPQTETVLREKLPWWHAIPGGSTVLLRAIPLLRMLGFKRFHLYGCDSCLMDAKHHVLSQPENESDVVIPVDVAGRIFACHPWMAAQAQEFMGMIQAIGDEIELSVKGDGLLAHILEAGAALSPEPTEPPEAVICTEPVVITPHTAVLAAE